MLDLLGFVAVGAGTLGVAYVLLLVFEAIVTGICLSLVIGIPAWIIWRISNNKSIIPDWLRKRLVKEKSELGNIHFQDYEMPSHMANFHTGEYYPATTKPVGPTQCIGKAPILLQILAAAIFFGPLLYIFFT